jgi:hypothetical protein
MAAEIPSTSTAYGSTLPSSTVILTTVPPLAGPADGFMLATTEEDNTSNRANESLRSTPLLLTLTLTFPRA